MRSTASSLMYPLTLSTALSPRSSQLRPRCLCLVSHSLPFFYKFESSHTFCPKSKNRPVLLVRSCTSITAKPSSQFRKKPFDSEQDEKLRSLREVFSKPGIGIDAYIIPSQDAHQVHLVCVCVCFLWVLLF